MSDPNTLGGIVRRRRLESGYSLGQLASKVGKTAAEVRAWERDAELPEHGILDRLAETLELDVGQIRAKVTEAQETAARQAADTEAEGEPEEPGPEEPEEPGPEEEETLDKSEDEDDSAAVAVVEPEESAEPAEPEAAATPEADTAADDEAETGEDLPGFPVEDPFKPPEPLADPEPEPSLLDAPTEAVPVPVITETAKTARAQRAAAVLEEPPLPMVEPAPDADPGLLRYLEPLRLLFDPHSRYLYWIRAGLTIIVMFVLVVFLFSMLGSLLDAVAELLDTIEPAATDPDDLDAFGVGWRV
jgi:transcriptional regulator with XRE-family HTH domain